MSLCRADFIIAVPDTQRRKLNLFVNTTIEMYEVLSNSPFTGKFSFLPVVNWTKKNGTFVYFTVYFFNDCLDIKVVWFFFCQRILTNRTSASLE